MSFLQCDPFEAINSTRRYSNHSDSNVQASVVVAGEPASSLPWNPAEAPLPARTEATGPSMSQVAIGLPLLTGQDSDLDLFPVLQGQALPVTGKVKSCGDMPSAHGDASAERHELIYSYFNPAGETTSFQSATPSASNMPYGEATPSTRLRTPGQSWEDYSGDAKSTQRSAPDQSKWETPVAGPSNFTCTPIRAYSASHVPRTDSRSSLPGFNTPARPATHSGPPQSQSTAKEDAPHTHHLARRSISYSVQKPTSSPHEPLNHVQLRAQDVDWSRTEADIAKQSLRNRSSPEKGRGGGSGGDDHSKSSVTSRASFFSTSLASENQAIATRSTTPNSSSPYQHQPPLGIPPHCTDLDTGAGAGAVKSSRPVIEADRQMAAKLQRGMLAQEQAREKMAEYFRPKLDEADGAAGAGAGAGSSATTASALASGAKM